MKHYLFIIITLFFSFFWNLVFANTGETVTTPKTKPTIISTQNVKNTSWKNVNESKKIKTKKNSNIKEIKNTKTWKNGSQGLIKKSKTIEVKKDSNKQDNLKQQNNKINKSEKNTKNLQKSSSDNNKELNNKTKKSSDKNKNTNILTWNNQQIDKTSIINKDKNISVSDQTSIDETIDKTKQQNDNLLLNILNKRKSELKKILSKTEAAKEVDQAKNKQRLLNIQKEILSSLNSNLNKEIQWIKKSIIKNKDLVNEMVRQKNLTKKQKKELDEYKNQNKLLLKKVKWLQQIIELNNSQIDKYKIAEKNQNLLLAKAVELKKELDTKQNKERLKKLNNVIKWLLLLIFIYLIMVIIEILYLKNKINKKYFYYDNLILLKSIVALIFVIYIIGSLFYIFPQYIFILFFAFSAVLIISAPIVWSYISSILLLWKINVGDRLIMQKEKIDWIVSSIWLISITLNEIENNKIQNKMIRISTRQLFLQPYKLEKDLLESYKLRNKNRKKDIYIDNIDQNEIKEFELTTDLSWEKLNTLLIKIDNLFKKWLSSRLDNKELYNLNYEIKEEKILIKITLKTNNKTENKLKLQIYNIIKDIKKEVETTKIENSNNWEW